MPYTPSALLTSVRHLPGYFCNSTTGTVGRMYVTGVPQITSHDNAWHSLTLPAAGADADCVCVHAPSPGYMVAAALVPGTPVLVEAGAAFVIGTILTPDALGRAVAVVGGNVAVLKALQDATAAGVYVWARVLSGR